MRCEVCGREILGQPYRRVIEGAKLTVCSRCAVFGTSDWTPGKPTPPRAPSQQAAPAPVRQVQRRPPRDDVAAVEQFELVENYGATIRKARQRHGFTEKDLAMRMQEKESVVKKLEKQELTPDNRLIAKIKKHLGVDIVERAETTKAQILAKPTGEKTIGDLMRLETDKEDKS
jgi:putative transcription factor